MINSFKENEARDSGIMFKSTLEQIKQIYPNNPAQAGELAISAIELLLTGDISSDDFIIKALLEPTKEVNKKNQKKHDAKTAANREKDIEENKLREIADLHKQKMTQAAIGKKLGINQATVSRRLDKIREKYPELLQENYAVYAKNANNENDNENDNDNVMGVNIASDILSPAGESKLSPESSPEEKEPFVF